MSDRLDEIRARAGALYSKESPTLWEHVRLSFYAREDIPYMLAEVERLRAALASLGYRLTRKDDGSDYVYWAGKDPVTEGGES